MHLFITTGFTCLRTGTLYWHRRISDKRSRSSLMLRYTYSSLVAYTCCEAVVPFAVGFLLHCSYTIVWLPSILRSTRTQGANTAREPTSASENIYIFPSTARARSFGRLCAVLISIWSTPHTCKTTCKSVAIAFVTCGAKAVLHTERVTHKTNLGQR